MAMKTIVFLQDDVDGGEADRTVTFSLDGTNFEIELSQANIERLTTAMQPFIDKARRTKGAKSVSSTKSGVDTAQVRMWAREQGLPISDRGRVPAEILDAYREKN